jgi:colanic acid/amylovoran biosynthesis glycosyltransferase
MNFDPDASSAASVRVPPLQPRVAYLAPELPALSATFVYEEMLALERRGIAVVPITVRRPKAKATEQSNLAARTLCVYDGSALTVVGRGLAGIVSSGWRSLGAFRFLVSDMAEVGWTRLAAWKLAYQFLAGVRLAAMLEANCCTHLHVHFADVPTQIAMYAAALSRIPFTVMAHANDIFENGLLLKKKAERASRMLTISAFNLRFLESMGIPGNRLAVVRCGVSFPVEEIFKRKSGSETIRIGTLGRMVEKKGFDILMRAVASLKSSGRLIELQIAGDGPLKAELEQFAHTLGVRSLTLFNGSLPHQQVAPWMRQLDIFVLACKQDQNGDMDGIPVALMEAMSQSVPVISTRLSGIPELVVHEETGLLARPGDHEDLAKQIARLIESPTLAEAMTSKAREHVNQEFGQAANIDRLIKYMQLSVPPRLN